MYYNAGHDADRQQQPDDKRRVFEIPVLFEKDKYAEPSSGAKTSDQSAKADRSLGIKFRQQDRRKTIGNQLLAVGQKGPGGSEVAPVG